jgi:hypothetical protein
MMHPADSPMTACSEVPHVSLTGFPSRCLDHRMLDDVSGSFSRGPRPSTVEKLLCAFAGRW